MEFTTKVMLALWITKGICMLSKKINYKIHCRLEQI